jgi:isopentenyl diphosphate isomerase/L-lactate dehydrogenase-like FMN-dependent dehydrogenase
VCHWFFDSEVECDFSESVYLDKCSALSHYRGAFLNVSSACGSNKFKSRVKTLTGQFHQARQSDAILNLDQVRLLARQRLPSDIFDYLDGGAGREVTQALNERDIDAITLKPLVMRDVAQVDTSTSVFNVGLRIPIAISPMALHRLVHPQGEIASAAAARKLQIPFTVGAMSSVTIEEVATGSGHTNLWLQTYLYKDQTVAPRLAMRAKAAGCRAIVVTVGCPAMGYRDRNLANRFTLPSNVSAAHFERSADIDHNNPIGSFPGAQIDDSATWKDVRKFCNEVELPVIVKGIMNAVDVESAIDAGVGGIIVSNHGGRQLDTSISTIRALATISKAVNFRVPLMVDSGFRRGTDVLKALALGADTILVGRPLLWALAVGGVDGIVDAVNRLEDELVVAMKLIGCPNIADLRSNCNKVMTTLESLDCLPTAPRAG